jgi:hypothetical protein
VHKTSKVHYSHYSAAEWVDKRKKKMIVLQELNDIDHSLEVVTAKGTVDNEKWRSWKHSHNVSPAAWNVLLIIIPASYFAKQLTNEGKLKRASEFQEKFPVVLHVLSNFLRLKKNFKVAGGSGKFRTINSETMMLGRDWTYEMGRRLFLAIMDLRETPGHNVAQDHVKQAYFHLLMSTLLTLKHSSMSMPAIWVWIVNSPNRLTQAVEYAGLNFMSYAIIQSKYIPAKNERLYDQSAHKQSADVFLMFFVKKGDKEAEHLRSKIRGEYCAPDIPYYVEAEKYQEMKYRLCASELRMEFYLDLIFDLCRLGDRLLGIFTGSKCLVAMQVCIILLALQN